MPLATGHLAIGYLNRNAKKKIVPALATGKPPDLIPLVSVRMSGFKYLVVFAIRLDIPAPARFTKPGSAIHSLECNGLSGIHKTFAPNPLASGAGNSGAFIIKMEKFVVVNGRILDFGEYANDFSLMQRIISLDVREYLAKLGFRQLPPQNKSVLKQEMEFYNPELDFEVRITTNKKHKPCFV